MADMTVNGVVYSGS